jgi:hypothetical protein
MSYNDKNNKELISFFDQSTGNQINVEGYRIDENIIVISDSSGSINTGSTFTLPNNKETYLSDKVTDIKDFASELPGWEVIKNAKKIEFHKHDNRKQTIINAKTVQHIEGNNNQQNIDKKNKSPLLITLILAIIGLITWIAKIIYSIINSN